MNAPNDCYEPDDEDLAYELNKERQLEGYRIEYAYLDRELRDYRKHTDRQLRELSKERKAFARDCMLEHEFNLAANCYYGEPSIVESRNNKASRPLTKKQAAINRSYRLLRASYLEAHPACQVRDCSETYGVTVHHIKGRGRHTLDVATFMTVCPRCHHWIHFVSPKKAREVGYLKT
jgi:hypothetical protein